MLRNPPPLRQLIRGCHGWWNLYVGAALIAWQVPRSLDCLANARRCKAPALVVTSGKDRVVPPRLQQRVIDAYAGEKRVMCLPDADHATRMTDEEAAECETHLKWLLDKMAS